MSRRVAGIVGREGSGKDEVLRYLHGRCSITNLSAGDVAREIAQQKGVSPTRENLHEIATKYMEEQGQGFFAERLIDTIEENDWQTIGISGVRTPYDVEVFRRHFGDDFRLVHVRVGNSKLRFQRLRRRNEVRDPDTYEVFLEQERQEEERFRISRAIQLADFTIDNDGSREQLQRDIEESPIWEWICSGPR